MGFFDSIGDFLGGAGKIVGVAAPVINAFTNRPRKAPAAGQLDARATQANQMASAAVNPDDPMYRNLVALEEEKGRLDIARSVNELLRQRRNMMKRLGDRRYAAWFNPEREDEALSSSVAREGAAVGERARKTVSARLLGGATGVQQGLGATTNLANIQGQQDQARRSRNDAIYRGIGGIGVSPEFQNWTKALNNRMVQESIYGPPGGYSYFGGPR